MTLKERYQNQGWGLLQVIEHMQPGNSVNEFVTAAKFILSRRVANNPKDNLFLSGWVRRLDRYKSLSFEPPCY